jgi:hypothetical protein
MRGILRGKKLILEGDTDFRPKFIYGRPLGMCTLENLITINNGQYDEKRDSKEKKKEKIIREKGKKNRYK